MMRRPDWLVNKTSVFFAKAKQTGVDQGEIRDRGQKRDSGTGEKLIKN